jgi:hypothetical protein
MRVSTSWNNGKLTPEQIKYAALDVFASLSIFQSFTSIPSEGPVVETMPAGTKVRLLSRDRKMTVAYGVLSPDQPKQFNGVNVTKTCTIINVTSVLVPAYLICHKLLPAPKDIPLSEYGKSIPFGLLCNIKDLRVMAGDTSPINSDVSHPHQPLPIYPFLSLQDPYTSPSLIMTPPYEDGSDPAGDEP